MFNVEKNLAVQSWCFRNFKTVEALLEQTKKIGLSRVELCAIHADFNDPAKSDGVIEQFKKAGVQITSIGVQTFCNNEAQEDKWLQFAKKAGCKMISAAFDPFKQPECFQTAEKLAEKYDINLGIHNHGGHDWLGSTQTLDYVFKKTGPRIGLCLDTAWMMAAGEDPIKAAERFKHKLYGAHIKDFVFDRAGKPEDVVVGTGNLNLKALLAIINEQPKCQSVTLEYEGDESNPGPKLKECVEKIRSA